MYRKAITHLKQVDPLLGQVIDNVGPCQFRANQEGSYFEALVRSIIYQQLSGKAASTIHQRLKDYFGGTTPEPEAILKTPDEALRALGVSRQKLSYLKDLASKVAQAEVPFHTLHELDDEAIIETLIKVKGIGRWTVQMFLISRLGRLNVLPDLDLGIQKGIQRAYKLETLPKPKQVLEIGSKWSPYCTIASWYLWRSIDGNEEE